MTKKEIIDHCSNTKKCSECLYYFNEMCLVELILASREDIEEEDE